MPTSRCTWAGSRAASMSASSPTGTSARTAWPSVSASRTTWTARSAAPPPRPSPTASPGPARSGTREDDELLGRPGHRDVAVDRALDARAELLGVDEDDQVEFESLGQHRGQR